MLPRSVHLLLLTLLLVHLSHALNITNIISTYATRPKSPISHIVLFKNKPSINYQSALGVPTFACAGRHLASGQFNLDMLQQLKAEGEVEAFEPDFEVTGADYVFSGDVANQTSPPNWGLVRISERSKKENSNRYSYPATAGSSVIVYLLDTGVNADHEQLAGRVTMGPNFSPTGQQVDTDLSSQDDNGHGTFIAGVIAGRDVGVAKKAAIVAVKILDSRKKAKISNVLLGLNWVYTQHTSRGPGAKSIINVSVDADRSDVLNSALSNCADAGIVVVAAAGNSDDSSNPVDACTRSPGSSSSSIVVGAFDSSDKVAGFSNRGACVDVYAPGVSIRSLSYSDTKGTTIDQGTSFACPHTTGVVAMLLADWQGSFTAQQVKDWLIQNATKDILKDVNVGVINNGKNVMLFSGGLVGRTDTAAEPASAATQVAAVGSAVFITVSATVLWSLFIH